MQSFYQFLEAIGDSPHPSQVVTFAPSRDGESDSALQNMMNTIDPTEGDLPDMVNRLIGLYRIIYPIDPVSGQLTDAWKNFRQKVEEYLNPKYEEGVADNFRSFFQRLPAAPPERMLEPRSPHTVQPHQAHFANALTYLRELHQVLPQLDKVLSPYPEAKAAFEKFMDIFNKASPQMEKVIRHFAQQAGHEPEVKAQFNYSSSFQGIRPGETPSQFDQRFAQQKTIRRNP